MADQQSNIKQENNIARLGMNMDLSVNQIPKGQYTYSLNGNVENFDASGISIQNETGNDLCLQFPEDFKNIGNHFIQEQNKHIFFLVNPNTGDCQIGYMDNNDCLYHTYIEDSCLGFNINYPVHKCVHKITNCSTEIYWTDGLNPRRFLDLNKIPYRTQIQSTICDVKTFKQIDCNKLKIQPNFSIPILEVVDVINGGNNQAGTYQFAIQYCDVAGDPYTSYYSITNPTPLANNRISTLDFNYNINKSIVLNISNIDATGYFQYYNIAVIKTINGIASVDLIGTFFIDNIHKQITYSGQNQTQIKLTISDIFEKFPFYDVAQDVTNVQDILVWDQLTSIDRINYQQIANKITLFWETWRIPATEDYSDELNSTNLRGYLRDEIYPFEAVFLLKDGKQTDGFHIPGRVAGALDLLDVPNTNPDFIGETNSLPYWQIYNTGNVIGTDGNFTNSPSYKGPYQYGQFSYWESTETYPCNSDVWGELSGQPIRHHKFPDVRVSPIFESSIYTSGSAVTPVMEKVAIFPIGVKLDVEQVLQLIISSNLTQDQKDNIAGFKIVRGDRSTNRSIIAKGILRNVGKYTREGTDYYFANYPYNDLREDPFLLENTNAFNAQCITYKFTVVTSGNYQYTDCFTNSVVSADMIIGQIIQVCSLTVPVIITGTITPPITVISPDTYQLSGNNHPTIFIYTDVNNVGQSIAVYKDNPVTIEVKGGTTPGVVFPFSGTWVQITTFRNALCYPNNLSAFHTDESKYRYVLNSPETSFGQPLLGNILKLENVVFGAGKGHFVEVKKNALYKLITKEAQEDALSSSYAIANITAPFNATAMFTAYQAYLQIYINGITRKNYGWSYNSIASYNYSANIDNNLGIKQRELDIYQYLIPAVESVGDTHVVNNYNRESSLYLKTKGTTSPLPFARDTPSLALTSTTSIIEDKSRYVNSQKDCAHPNSQFDISVVSYYASIKNIISNQWGQMYSYETIDTGFQTFTDAQSILKGTPTQVTIFGGDTFINKFSFKTKLPFFIDNRVGAPDDSDIFYDEIGNVAYPQYWHSARSILYDYKVNATPTYGKNLISIKAHYFDCPNNQLPVPDPVATPPIVNPDRTFYNGKMYMFAYGIPTIYCESSINVDLRQAFNNKEGDFFPHVSTDIPDEWVQESFVPIAFDNTYYYNISYSKQNKENLFTHLPINWTEQLCFTHFPFRTIYSDPQQSFTDNRINSWLIYRAVSYFDFPQNYGKLTSLDGIQNKAVLARFENKSLLYNTLLTIDTSNPQAAYLGNSTLFRSSPPIDFAETDLGYVGSQHKMLLKIPQGQITIDAKRGQVFLVSGNSVSDLSAFGSGLNRFFTDHLAFEILRYFPNVNIDNHFTGIGLHGVYDSKFDRVIISKLDYIPLSEDIKYDDVNKEFYILHTIPQNPPTTSSTTTNPDATTSTTTTIPPIITRQVVDLTDSTYFCNKSWTLSYNINTQSWISFHSYIPNFYIAENNFFYSGINEGCDLEAIVAIEVPTTTTTSTSTSTTSTTSTTSSSTSTTTTSTSTTTSTTSTTTTLAPNSFNGSFTLGSGGVNVMIVPLGSYVNLSPSITFIPAGSATPAVVSPLSATEPAGTTAHSLIINGDVSQSNIVIGSNTAKLHDNTASVDYNATIVNDNTHAVQITFTIPSVSGHSFTYSGAITFTGG